MADTFIDTERGLELEKISPRVATVAMRPVKQIFGGGQNSACSRKFLNQSTVIEQPAWLIPRMTKMTTQSTGYVRNIAK